MVKCNFCRKPTTWFIAKDRKIRCKKCKKAAPPNINEYKCRHKFVNNQGIFTPNCMKCGIEIELDPNNLPRVPEIAQAPLDLNNINLNTDELLNITETLVAENNVQNSVGTLESASELLNSGQTNENGFSILNTENIPQTQDEEFINI